MIYYIENDFLKVGVTTAGAQICSVVRKCDGVEHIWQADPAVWGYHGPVMFPHCGKLTGGKMLAKGQELPSAQHGFARLLEHTLVARQENALVFELTDGGETYKWWPYKFRLVSTVSIDGDRVDHTLTVENRDDCPLNFGIGYHPAYAVPFDGSHTATDYELRFDQPENPIRIATPDGLVSGEFDYFGRNVTAFPVDDQLFAEGSHCMTGLRSQTLGLYEKDSTRGVVCRIREFPYCLMWSQPGEPHFVCIEPWYGLPGTVDGSPRWEDKPSTATLKPGESWSCTMETRYVR